MAQDGDIPTIFGLKIGALFGKYAGNASQLRLAVCGECVLEVTRTGELGESYSARFPNHGEGGTIYSPDATLGSIVLEHCNCGKYQ